MPGYEYANARLRAMKSRLLSSHQLDQLAASEHLDSFMAALTNTVYQSALAAALVQATGLEAIDLALRHDLVQTVRRIRGFFGGPERELVGMVLLAYDIHNLKAILRGLSKGAVATDIIAAFLPIGQALEPVMLAELANAPDPRAAIDLLASAGLPLAYPLLRLRAETPGATIHQMELALDRWYFSSAYDQLSDMPGDTSVMVSMIGFEADLTNLLTTIRLVCVPDERDSLAQGLGSEHLRSIFVRPGRLTLDLMLRAVGQNSIEALVALLEDTAYAEALRSGLNAYHRSRRLSDLERYLRQFRLRWMKGLMAKDPLGIGVLLGYLALKTAEVGNLRWIANGVSIGLDAAVLRQELELVA